LGVRANCSENRIGDECLESETLNVQGVGNMVAVAPRFYREENEEAWGGKYRSGRARQENRKTTTQKAGGVSLSQARRKKRGESWYSGKTINPSKNGDRRVHERRTWGELKVGQWVTE